MTCRTLIGSYKAINSDHRPLLLWVYVDSKQCPLVEVWLNVHGDVKFGYRTSLEPDGPTLLFYTCMTEPFVKIAILDLTLQDEAQKKNQTKRYYRGHVSPSGDLFYFCLAKIKIQQEHFLAWLEKGLLVPQLHSNTFCREHLALAVLH